MRYVYYFVAASLIAIVHFCSQSELMLSLSKLITNSWERKLRDMADSPE
jgi:hypothetical protein